jgi:Na+-driven multidrug efflux pump
LLWAILSLIPFSNLFAYRHYSSEFSEFNDGKYPFIVVFIAWVLFSPLVWLLVQIGLNKAADG